MAIQRFISVSLYCIKNQFINASHSKKIQLIISFNLFPIYAGIFMLPCKSFHNLYISMSTWIKKVACITTHTPNSCQTRQPSYYIVACMSRVAFLPSIIVINKLLELILIQYFWKCKWVDVRVNFIVKTFILRISIECLTLTLISNVCSASLKIWFNLTLVLNAVLINLIYLMTVFEKFASNLLIKHLTHFLVDKRRPF